MSNLAAAFDAAGQSLDQIASVENNREMQDAMATRAENLAYLKNRWAMQRELTVEGVRKQALIDVTDHRTAAEHTARDEEIDRQEAGRGRNQAAAQHRSLSDAEALQDNAFVNQGELQGRQARVQATRDAATQASQARAQKAQIREWLTKYSAQIQGSNNTNAFAPKAPLTTQQLAERAQHDPVLKSQLQAYRDADTRERAATRAMGKFPSPYDTPSTPGAVAPANDALASPPTSSLTLIPSEGSGISDNPYPSPSGADELFMSGGGNGGGGTVADSGSTDY